MNIIVCILFTRTIPTMPIIIQRSYPTYNNHRPTQKVDNKLESGRKLPQTAPLLTPAPLKKSHSITPRLSTNLKRIVQEYDRPHERFPARRAAHPRRVGRGESAAARKNADKRYKIEWYKTAVSLP